MQLADFRLMDRGPRRFDVWESRDRLTSPIGDFNIEFQVEIGASPTPEMIAAAEHLVAKFASDKETLAQRILDSYNAICGEPYAADWLAECNVPFGLSMPELSRYLNPRTLTVDSELNMSVYTSPDWDREHGLYFDLVDGEWQSSE